MLNEKTEKMLKYTYSFATKANAILLSFLNKRTVIYDIVANTNATKTLNCFHVSFRLLKFSKSNETNDVIF